MVVDEKEKYEEIRKKLGLEYSVYALLKPKVLSKEQAYL